MVTSVLVTGIVKTSDAVSISVHRPTVSTDQVCMLKRRVNIPIMYFKGVVLHTQYFHTLESASCGLFD